MWIQGVIMVLLDLVLEANFMYCRTYFSAIPLESYFLAGNLKDFQASVWDSIRCSDVILPLVTILTFWTACKVRNRYNSGIFWKYLILTIVSGLLSWILAAIGGGYKAQISKMEESCYYSTCVVPVYTIFGNIIYQATQNSSSELTADDVLEIETWLKNKAELRSYTALPDSVSDRIWA